MITFCNMQGEKVVLSGVFSCIFLLATTVFSLSIGHIEKMRLKHSVPGCAVVVSSKEGDRLFVRGVSSIRSGKKITPNTVFQIGSISKTFAAIAILRLATRGIISLDDPIDRYLAWLPDARMQKISIRQLLEHTSGLKNFIFNGRESGDSEDDYLIKCAHSPGSKFLYSGLNYLLLQNVIEAVLSISFVDYMTSFFSSLEMKDSFFALPLVSIQCADLAQGHNFWNSPLPFYSYNAPCAAGQCSSIEDLQRFIHFQLEASRFNDLDLPFAWSYPNPITEEKGVYYGLGYEIQNLGDGKLVYHLGTNRGWNALFALLPHKKSGMAVLTNSDNGYGFVIELLDKWVEEETGYLPRSSYREGRNIYSYFQYLLLGIAIFIFFLFSNRFDFSTRFWRLIFSVCVLLPCFMVLFFYTPLFYPSGWTKAAYLPQTFHCLSAYLCLICVVFLFGSGVKIRRAKKKGL